ncbi:MAG TPA: hypothetical protein VLX29_10235 [Nitrospirota bacterium]|nr:hypothetical protein [Nitrospirota bacterium]
MKNCLLAVSFLIVCSAVFGCASAPIAQKEIGAFIEPTPGWTMVKKCADEECALMVDFLKSNSTTIRIEFDNDRQAKQFFIIRTEFITVRNQCRYNLSDITVQLNHRDTLKPKVFSCYYTLWDLQSMRNRPSLEGSMLLNKEECYLLFFDHAALSDNDEAVLNINDAFTILGSHVDVPLVHFKKNPSMR